MYAGWWQQQPWAPTRGQPGTTSKAKNPTKMSITFPRGVAGYSVLLAQGLPLVVQADGISDNLLLITVEMGSKTNDKSKGSS